MIYAQFYSMSTGYVDGTIPPQFDDAHKKPIEACGDCSIVIIDARLSKENIGVIAAKTCKERGYCGYRIFKGNSILNGKTYFRLLACCYKSRQFFNVCLKGLLTLSLAQVIF